MSTPAMEEKQSNVSRRAKRRRIAFEKINTSKKKRSKRHTIWSQTKGRCVYCNAETAEKERSLDHVYPKAFGGTLAIANLIPACADCNTRRGNKVPASSYAHPEWRKYVAKKERAMGLPTTQP